MLVCLHGFPGAARAIRGGRSSYSPGADARRLTAADCPVETLDGAGHALHVDRPDRLVDLLLAGPP